MVYKTHTPNSASLIKPSIAALAHRGLDIILPSSCLICSQITQSSSQMCRTCKILIKQAETSQFECCIRCHVKLDRPETGVIFADTAKDRQPDGALHCAQCLSNAIQYEQCISAVVYNPLTGKLVNLLKHQRKLAAITSIAGAMTVALERHYQNLPATIDFAIPVPLHPRRLQLRGFNQANEIAKPICQHFNIPLNPHLSQRQRDSLAQQNMRLKARQTNLQGAFALSPAALQHQPIRGKRIAIIDDVMTTGTTANAVASSLLAAGAKRCDIWCYARTPRAT